MQGILNIAIRAARKGGAYFLRERVRKDQRLSASDLHLFQEQAAEILQEIIQKAYPTHQLLFSHRPSVEVDTSAEAVWHIDLLDGVENFICNIPHYSIAIVIEEKGRAQYAMIYDPNADEIFSGALGGGVRYNNLRCRASQTIAPAQALFGFSHIQQLPLNLNFLQMGSAALTMAYVAAGRVDAFLGEHMSDIALKTGCLLMKEAGAVLGDWQGGIDYMTKTQLIAANPRLFKATIALLRGEEIHDA